VLFFSEFRIILIKRFYPRDLTPLMEGWFRDLEQDTPLYKILKQIYSILSSGAFQLPEWVRDCAVDDGHTIYSIAWPQHGVFVEIHDLFMCIEVEFRQCLKQQNKKRRFILHEEEIDGFFGKHRSFLHLLFPHADDTR